MGRFATSGSPVGM